MLEYEVKVLDAIRSKLEGYPSHVILDNKHHHFHTVSSDKKNRSGWYIIACDSDYAYGAFGDFRTGEKHGFCSKNLKEMSHEERIKFKEKQAKQEAHRKRELEKIKKETAIKAAKLCDRAVIDNNHPYLLKKQIKNFSNVGVAYGCLVVPAYRDGEIVSAQMISLDGKKFLKGQGASANSYHTIGDFSNADKIAIVEGYATGASVHEATGLPVVVAFGTSGLAAVTKYVRKKNPSALLILCADNDKKEAGINAAQNAIKGISNAVIRLCPIHTDFNDLHCLQGLQAVRDAIFPQAVVQENHSVAELEYTETENWWTRWVYINSHGKYYSLDDRQFYAAEAFNLKCTSLVPSDEKKTATSFVTAKGLIDVIAQPTYAPNIKDLFFTESNKKCINTYNHAGELKPANIISEGGTKAINAILKHIWCICNRNDEHYNLMVNWLAWQVQRRGEKILWSPVIQGIDGIGKSFIGDVARNMLGNENVNIVKPTEIMGSYNGWATGACLVIVNEIKITGHNRYDVVNSLKPLITDPYIQISEKYVASYNVLNVSNYFCTTNHKDAIPITSTDRRWWILYSEYETLADFLSVVQGGDDYFTKLYDGLYEHLAEVLKYFMDWEISDSFIKAKQAPQTIHKEHLLRNEDAKLAGFSEAREILAQGGAYFTEEIVCSNDFFKTLTENVDDFELKTSNRAVFMQKLGYNIHKCMKIDGKTRKVWVKKSGLDDDYIRNEMMKTVY